MRLNGGMKCYKLTILAVFFLQKFALSGSHAKHGPDVVALAEHLGLTSADQGLMYIAEAALSARVPYGWVEHCDANGAVFFYNKQGGQSTWEHPMDCFFKLIARRLKHTRGKVHPPPGVGGGRGAHRSREAATTADSVLSSMQTPKRIDR